MSKFYTKRQCVNQEWFKSEVAKRLVALGVTQRGDEKAYPYLLDTIHGSLEIAPCDGWVACEWVDIAHVKRRLRDGRLNPISGKWNHHYPPAMFNSRRDAQLAVDDFFSALSVILPQEDAIPA
jgi:hypothetical protein